jgi:uncharacterized repeat protein (TIGR02543 family)
MRKLIHLSVLLFLLPISVSLSQTSIDVASSFDFQLAMNFANANGVDTIYLTTPGGLYTTTDTSFFHVNTPLVIMPKPGVTEMPVFTHSDDSANVLEIFRISDDLTIQGVIFDGGHAQSHGMKYALRAGNGPNDFPLFKEGSNIIVRNCVFKDIYQDKDPQNTGGHALYFLKGVVAGTVIVEDCIIMNTGDEAIRMSETEKFATERVVDTLIVRNVTFNNTGSECIRFYADTDTSTADAYVLIENLTIDNCATRTMYIKNNQNTVVRNIIISNSRLPDTDRSDRSDYLIEVQQRGSYISNVDTINTVFGPVPREVKLRGTKGAIGVIEGTVFSFDPQYTDAVNLDYNLAASSPAHYSGEDNVHLGDLRWPNANPTVTPLNVVITGEGSVLFNPEREGLVFPTGTVVEVTADADSGYAFAGWGGDLSGTTNPESITVDAEKNVTALFSPATGVDDELTAPAVYALDQNYPNPFNPTTSIRFSIKEAGRTSIILYDALGQQIKTLFDTELNAGQHYYNFNGDDLSSGIYFYQIQSGDFSATKKMMLLK